MARKRKGDKVDGWINLDKPVGMTSTQAFAKVRRYLNAQKAGHAGTLDPLASGILPIALGEATKTIPYVQDSLKTYYFAVTWGEERDTDDAEGAVTATSDVRPTRDQINAVLPRYTGEISQMPPRYSALKIDGQRAYDLARAGQDVVLEARNVYIEWIELLETTENTAIFRCFCGKGTYVRSLARDIARDLGTCGYISLLRRESVGGFTLESSISLDKLEQMADSLAALLPLRTALDDIPALALRSEEVAKLKSGQSLSFISRPDFERLTKIGLGGTEIAEALAVFQDLPVAIVETSGPDVRPVRVLNL